MSAQAARSSDLSAGGTLRLASVDVAKEAISIGRYEILSELGRGAMARVYLARDPNIGRKVALKVLEPRGLLTEVEMRELRTRFLLEARAAGKLRHPGAVAIYDADHDAASGHSFIAMEWVDGQSLDRMLKARIPLPLDQTVSIVCQIAAALDAAHQQGLIHRDVKPGNILIDNDGNAKLSDFGIAKIESLELTSTGQVLGTPFYMSPEQILDEPLDGRSDLFSLGVVLYQCATGELPFQSDALPALTHKILNVDPRVPRQVNPQLPEPVSVTLMKALEKDPDKRFQTGIELARALGHEVVPITPTVGLTLRSSRLLEAPERQRFGKRSVPGIVLAAILLTTLIIGLSSHTRQNEESGDSTLATAQIDSSPAGTSAARAAPEISEAGPRTPPTTVTESTEYAAVGDEAVAAQSTLMISYTNRLKEATMDVWLDGNHVHSRRLFRQPGLMRRAVGSKDLVRIPVPAGHHDVRVRIQGKEGKIEAANWSGNTFEKGGSHLLRLELIPPKYLKMTWK